jgi:Rab3 GTPase-activating protein catalytic subunit
VVDPETNEETTLKKYDLSQRMKIPNNVWVEVWQSANPVPARRQKRLFDDTKEAENVILQF